MFILGKEQRVTVLLRNRHGNNFLLQSAAADGLGRALLAPEREEILILARDVKFFGDVFAGLRHRIDAVLGFHPRVDEPPAERGVFHFQRAREGAVRFGDDKGRSRHALDAAGNHEIGFAGLDGPGRGSNGVHTRAAEPVNRCSRHFFRKTRQQERHSRDVAVVFACLIRAAIDDVIYGVPIDTCIALDKGFKRNRCEIIGPNGGKRSAVAPERRPNRVADVSSLHRYPRNFSASYLSTEACQNASLAYALRKCSQSVPSGMGPV